jgi:hypothetical protein
MPDLAEEVFDHSVFAVAVGKLATAQRATDGFFRFDCKNS